MSDLQCPATIVLLTPETAAVSDMSEYRLARVIYARSLATAEAAALSFGQEAAAEDIEHSQALTTRIAELADMYRGEQVAIIASERAIGEAAHLATPLTAAVVLAVDSDGWRLLSR